MKVKIILSFLLVCILASFISAQNCTDSDSRYAPNERFYVKGITEGFNYFNPTEFISVEDYCFDKSLNVSVDSCYSSFGEYKCIIYESHCEGNLVYTGPVYCSDHCINGACININQTQQNNQTNQTQQNSVTCTDSDGGKDYFKKGYFTNSQGSGGEDACFDSNTLLEGYCDSSCNHGLCTIFYNCSDGCVDGVCLRMAQNQTQQNTPTCTDSDDGLDFYTKGNTKSGEDIWRDYCIGDSVQEQYCEGNIAKQYQSYKCSNGCEDGACIRESMESCLNNPNKYWDQKTENCYDYKLSSIKELCDDPDGGKRPHVSAHTFGFRSYSSADDPDKDLRIRTGGKDSCLDEEMLIEHYCSTEGYIMSYQLKCEFGCRNDKCEGTQEEIDPEQAPIKLPRNDFVRNITYVCKGCEIDNKCYPFTYRKGGKYCSIEEETFISQRQPDSICENNFECSSNVCVSGKCIDEGFIQKILNWFKNLFG